MAPYGIFEAGDGQPFYPATASEKLYRRLCRTLEREGLLTDERFETATDRWENRDVLRAELESAFERHDRRELVELLADFGIPAGPLRSIDELVDDDPHADHRDLFVETYNQWLETECRTTRVPFRFADGTLEPASLPPQKGEHTRAVLGEYGYDDETISDLLDAGVLRESS